MKPQTKSKKTKNSGCDCNSYPVKSAKPSQKLASKPKKEVDSMSFTRSSNAIQTQKAQPTQSTQIVIKCNCGFPNNLFIRGEGIAELSWNKGQPLKNVKADEWVWETNRPFIKGQFKILINDKQYEVGENHLLECGKKCTFTPRF